MNPDILPSLPGIYFRIATHFYSKKDKEKVNSDVKKESNKGC